MYDWYLPRQSHPVLPHLLLHSMDRRFSWPNLLVKQRNDHKKKKSEEYKKKTRRTKNKKMCLFRPRGKEGNTQQSKRSSCAPRMCSASISPLPALSSGLKLLARAKKKDTQTRRRARRRKEESKANKTIKEDVPACPQLFSSGHYPAHQLVPQPYYLVVAYHYVFMTEDEHRYDVRMIQKTQHWTGFVPSSLNFVNRHYVLYLN